MFESVEHAGTIDCNFCMPYEDDKPVWIARRGRQSLDTVWPGLKHYD